MPCYSALCMDTTRFSRRFSDNSGADMQVSILSISVHPERFHLQCLWAIWTGPSSLKPVNYISDDVSGWAPTAAIGSHPSNKQMQLMHRCRCALEMGPHDSLTRSKCQQLNCFCPHHYFIPLFFWFSLLATKPLEMFHFSKQQFSVRKRHRQIELISISPHFQALLSVTDSRNSHTLFFLT